MTESISGGMLGPGMAPKGRRFATGIIDLFDIPIFLGLLIGVALLNVPDTPRNIILVLVNMIWLVFRDFVFSPARAMVGVKLISLTGGKVSIWQAILRNVLLIIPIVLVIGYLVEIIFLLVKGERLGDRIAKTRVVLS